MPLDELFLYRARLLDLLERQPAELARALAAIPESEWAARRTPDGSRPHQLTAHVRDLEVLAFVPRFRRILSEDNPVLESFPSHLWSAEAYRPDEPAADILAAFAYARAEALDLMRGVTSEAWTRTGFHPPSGRRTAQWWAERMYTHAQAHLADLRRAAQNQSTDTFGGLRGLV